MVRIIKNHYFWLLYGGQLHTFTLGISVGKYGFSLDLGFVWVSVEW